MSGLDRGRIRERRNHLVRQPGNLDRLADPCVANLKFHRHMAEFPFRFKHLA